MPGICSRCRLRPSLPYHAYCRECHRAYGKQPTQRAHHARRERDQRRTAEGWAAVRWVGMRYRVRTHPAYRTVEIRIDRASFMAWAVPALTAWREQHPDGWPTIDRIDSAGHYEAGNLQVLSQAENSGKKRYRPNQDAPVGMAWCSACRQYRPLSEFWKHRQTGHGLQRRCKTCQYAATRASLAKRRAKEDA